MNTGILSSNYLLHATYDTIQFQNPFWIFYWINFHVLHIDLLKKIVLQFSFQVVTQQMNTENLTLPNSTAELYSSSFFCRFVAGVKPTLSLYLEQKESDFQKTMMKNWWARSDLGLMWFLS